MFHFIYDQVKDLLLPLQIGNKLFHVYCPSKIMALTTSEFIHKFEGLNRMNSCLTKKNDGRW